MMFARIVVVSFLMLYSAACWATYGDFVYSNFAVTVLGDAMGILDKTTWYDDLKKRVTGPLGMTNTDIYEQLEKNAKSAWAVRSCGFDKNGKESCTSYPPSPSGPAGGLWSTGDDMLKGLAYNLLNVAVSPALEKARTLARTPQASGHCNGYKDAKHPSCTNANASAGSHDNIGLGWNLDQDSTLGMVRISKDGDITNFHAYAAFSADGQRGVAVLLNSDTGPDRATIGDMLLHSMP
jgi:CubicO group peptidase (beta-lactamase class C family)